MVIGLLLISGPGGTWLILCFKVAYMLTSLFVIAYYTAVIISRARLFNLQLYHCEFPHGLSRIGDYKFMLAFKSKSLIKLD